MNQKFLYQILITLLYLSNLNAKDHSNFYLIHGGNSFLDQKNANKLLGVKCDGISHDTLEKVYSYGELKNILKKNPQSSCVTLFGSRNKPGYINLKSIPSPSDGYAWLTMDISWITLDCVIYPGSLSYGGIPYLGCLGDLIFSKGDVNRYLTSSIQESILNLWKRSLKESFTDLKSSGFSIKNKNDLSTLNPYALRRFRSYEDDYYENNLFIQNMKDYYYQSLSLLPYTTF
jgi:hypothetical protein